jgi:hypothetical protein
LIWGKTGYLVEVAKLNKPLEAIEKHFSKVTDPRLERTKDHKLTDILSIAICAEFAVQKGGRILRILGRASFPG